MIDRYIAIMRGHEMVYYETQDFTICPLCDNRFQNGDNIISVTKNAYPKNFVGGDPVGLFHAGCYLNHEGEESIPEIMEEKTTIHREDE